MSEIYIAKEKLPGVVAELMGRTRVFAPVAHGQYHDFAQLTDASAADLSYQNTRLSPKGLFHPHGERMFDFSLAKEDPEANILKETPKDYSPRVLLGIRPCDAKALSLCDVNFDTATYKDPWWVQRRESSTLVGLACNSPCSTCFCTSMGTGPFDTAGLDALMVDTGEGYLLRAVSEKGEALISGISGGEAVPAEAASKAEALTKASREETGTICDIAPLARKPMLDLFNAPFWDEFQFACINCGTCTFLCPTCWCFDIQDEVHGETGERLKMWDSCMFPLFTFHGSGHNPRSVKLQRVRQRFMHKLKYYQDKYGQGPACVGCGRCVKACPVNIDIRQVARVMSASCVCPA